MTTVIGATVTPADRRTASRTRILDAAAHAFRAKGYAATGVDAVMSAAGMTHGGFYAHFRSKAAMLAATMLHLRQPRHLTVVQAVDGVPAAPGRGRHRLLPDEAAPRPSRGRLPTRPWARSCRPRGWPAGAAAPHIQGFVRLLAPHLPDAEDGRDARAQAVVVLLVGGIVTARNLPDRQAGPWLEACRRAARRIAGIAPEAA